MERHIVDNRHAMIRDKGETPNRTGTREAIWLKKSYAK